VAERGQRDAHQPPAIVGPHGGTLTFDEGAEQIERFGDDVLPAV
jgi:hypothetical protein